MCLGPEMPPEALRESQVFNELETMRMRVANLITQIEELAKVLTPVLREEAGELTITELKEEVKRVPLAESIANIGKEIERQTMLLSNITSKIEI